MEARTFFFTNLILEVTPCHYYCILLVRSESLGRAHYEWEGITQDVKIRRQEPLQRLTTMRLVVFLTYEALPLDPERTPCSLYTEAQDYFYSVNFMGLGVCVLVECSSHLFFLPPTLQFLFSFCSSFLASSAFLLLSILLSILILSILLIQTPCVSLSSHSLSSHLPFRIQILCIFPATVLLTVPLSAHRDQGQF